jgi:glutamine synthetase
VVTADKPAHLTVGELANLVDRGEIDTVVACLTDVQGRLQGKRLHARYFLDEVVDHGTEACNYLLAVDVDMNTVGGFAISSWERGYGDFVLQPDLATLRRASWLPATAIVQCDVLWLDGSPVLQSPRQILKAQVDRAAELGFVAVAGTELEFLVFEDTYEQAWDRRYAGLTPANRYNVDYSILGTGRIEPLLRDIRNAMYTAGLRVESAKGECNFGQHEIAFRYGEVVTTADDHALYKTAAKEIAAAHGKSLTFMSKYDEREGNSCHIHMSLRGLGGEVVFDRRAGQDHPDAGGPGGGRERTEVFDGFVAGILATLREFTLLYAPNINSYKRFAPGSFAPTKVAWGEDNRTCSVRVVGAGSSLRPELRLPGGDVNPYVALAGMLAAGLHGIRNKLTLPSAYAGNAYASELSTVPTTLREARDLFDVSSVAREAFGDEVVEHYVNAADVELAAFEAAVTDWERVRGFERL